MAFEFQQPSCELPTLSQLLPTCKSSSISSSPAIAPANTRASIILFIFRTRAIVSSDSGSSDSEPSSSFWLFSSLATESGSSSDGLRVERGWGGGVSIGAGGADEDRGWEAISACVWLAMTDGCRIIDSFGGDRRVGGGRQPLRRQHRL